jgi:hypothetical protein
MAGCASILSDQDSSASDSTWIDLDVPSLPYPKSVQKELLDAIDHRNYEICRQALIKCRSRWRGVSWLCSTLESRASHEADVDLSETGTGVASTMDKGEILRMAQANSRLEVRRKARERTSGAPIDSMRSEPLDTAVLGLSAWGTTHEPESSRLSVLRTNNPAFAIRHPSEHWSSYSSSVVSHANYPLLPSLQPTPDVTLPLSSVPISSAQIPVANLTSAQMPEWLNSNEPEGLDFFGADLSAVGIPWENLFAAVEGVWESFEVSQDAPHIDE